MTEWICLKCNRITQCSNKPECCGDRVPFDLMEHGRRLIGASNSYIQIYKEWDTNFSHNTLIKEASNKLQEKQCSSMPIHMIKGIQALIKFYEDNTPQQNEDD